MPFALFVSLSASENVLPSMGSEYATDPNSSLAQRSRSALGGVADSAGAAVAGMGGMLNVRSPSRDVHGGRSQSSVRDGDLGLGDTRVRGRKRAGKGLVRVAVDGVREWVGETGEVMGLWQGDRTRRW